MPNGVHGDDEEEKTVVGVVKTVVGVIVAFVGQRIGSRQDMALALAPTPSTVCISTTRKAGWHSAVLTSTTHWKMEQDWTGGDERSVSN